MNYLNYERKDNRALTNNLDYTESLKLELSWSTRSIVGPTPEKKLYSKELEITF